MKHHRLFIAALLALGLIAAVPAGAAAPVCQIVIGSCHRVPLSSADGTGIIDRITIEAFRRIGLSACIEQLPCERSLLNADAGLTDGDILRIPKVLTERYPNLVGVPEVLYALPMTAFTTRPDLHVKDFADLARLRVGFILGWKILEDRVQAADTLRVRGPEELFPLLPDGQADVVIYEGVTGLHLAKEMKLQGIRALEPPLVVTPQYLVLHRRHEKLLPPLAEAIRAIKADGSYAAAFRQAGQHPPASR